MSELEAIGFVRATIQRYDEELKLDSKDISILSLTMMGEEGFMAEAKIPSGDIFKIIGNRKAIVADRYKKVDSKKWVGSEKEETA